MRENLSHNLLVGVRLLLYLTIVFADVIEHGTRSSIGPDVCVYSLGHTNNMIIIIKTRIITY